MVDIELLKPVVLEAGAAIMRHSKGVRSEAKEDGSPVTVADHESNRIITTKLRELFPEHGILSEESAAERQDAPYIWVIDPLDGTKEFLKGNGEFTINVALVHNGEPILGIIYAPALDLLYWAGRGKGAYCGERRIHVSKEEEFSRMTLAVSRSHVTESEGELQRALKIEKVLSRGSSLKGCMVAEGKADIYYRAGNVHEWDICAMESIIREAGGTLSDLEGKPFKYACGSTLIEGGFLASNGKMQQELLEVIHETRNIRR